MPGGRLLDCSAKLQSPVLTSDHICSTDQGGGTRGVFSRIPEVTELLDRELGVVLGLWGLWEGSKVEFMRSGQDTDTKKPTWVQHRGRVCYSVVCPVTNT
jgi:hypothetical protein